MMLLGSLPQIMAGIGATVQMFQQTTHVAEWLFVFICLIMFFWIGFLAYMGIAHIDFFLLQRIFQSAISLSTDFTTDFFESGHTTHNRYPEHVHNSSSFVFNRTNTSGGINIFPARNRKT
mmetsp:Transcript_6623/g.5441  ORF Transcript_6623/g.5441 Transcript_6623/m.5441 type:complete len:120 (-) Transcript_6623:61-420(-)